MSHGCNEIDRDGFTLLPGVFDEAEVAGFVEELERILHDPSPATFIRSRGGAVYAARNILELWPRALMLWRRPPLIELLEEVLGSGHGLVRGLFFDKPPDQSWGLPWHKDLTIAVREHGEPLAPFTHPT